MKVITFLETADEIVDAMTPKGAPMPIGALIDRVTVPPEARIIINTTSKVAHVDITGDYIKCSEMPLTELLLSLEKVTGIKFGLVP